MTYCVAIHTDAGLVFLADSRTNAGVDHISTFRKLTVFERPGERVLALMTAGNLSLSQSVISELTEGVGEAEGLWAARNMYDAARVVGEAVRKVYRREISAFEAHQVDFNISMILGGQIGKERCRLFQIYSAGNFIESGDSTHYFQIGESKYGKPIIDRVVDRNTTLDAAAKCALTSMDSTLRSNISVGMPLDLLIYEADSLRVTRFSHIQDNDPYFRKLSDAWSERLRRVFHRLPALGWPDPTSPFTSGESGPAQEPIRAHPAGGFGLHKPASEAANTTGAPGHQAENPSSGDSQED